MKRKKPGERVAKLRVQDGEPFVTLRRKAARWLSDNLAALKIAKPGLPGTLNDRAQDNWESLLAIADLAGGDWPDLARAAAEGLSAGARVEADAQSIRVELLGAIKSTFELLRVDRLSSKTLVDELAKDGDGPWAAFGKAAKPISQRQLAAMLSGFKIEPTNVRLDNGDQRKGYDVSWFKDPFERYLSQHSPSRSVPSVPANDINSLEQKSSVPTKLAGTDKNTANPLKTKVGTAGTDRNPLPGKNEGSDRGMCAQCKGVPDGKEQIVSLAGGETVWLHRECRKYWFDDHPAQRPDPRQ
jgi:hypothetical protein